MKKRFIFGMLVFAATPAAFAQPQPYQDEHKIVNSINKTKEEAERSYYKGVFFANYNDEELLPPVTAKQPAASARDTAINVSFAVEGKNIVYKLSKNPAFDKYVVSRKDIIPEGGDPHKFADMYAVIKVFKNDKLVQTKKVLVATIEAVLLPEPPTEGKQREDNYEH
jgi:hypothetical protein